MSFNQDCNTKFGKLIGAIDEGTTSTRFIIFKAGTDDIVCYHQKDVPSIYPNEGWCEQDPMVIFNLTKDCIDSAVKQLVKMGGSANDIVAVGITNQRESSVVWDANTGKPLHNAIIWLDNRTTSTVETLIESITSGKRDKDHLRPLCGLPISPYFSAVKLRWLWDNVPKVQQAMQNGTCRFGTIDSWLIYNFTGGLHITDVTNASRTMLMNLQTLQWDDKLLSFFGLPRSILPEIRSSAEKYGDLTVTLLKGIPLTSCLGDQQAALVGQQCFKKGQAKATFGTGCFLLYNTENTVVQSKFGLLTTVGYKFGPEAKPVYALEGSIAIAGAVINWLRDNMGLIVTLDDVERMARSVPDTNDVYFVPAFSGLYAPHWNQEARGTICGLNTKTRSEHIVRAALESLGFQVRDITDAIKKDSGIAIAKLMVDGGMSANNLFLQIIADIVGIPVVRAKIAETTALGAALAAYKVIEPNFNMSAPLSNVEETHSTKPTTSSKERERIYKRWQDAIEIAKDWDVVSTQEEEIKCH